MPERATVDRTCQRCGAPFKAKPSKVRIGKGKFCSRACAGTQTKPREERTCPCGETFNVPGWSTKRFHSKRCAALRGRPAPSPAPHAPTRQPGCQPAPREPQTWVPTAELAPIIAEAIAERGIQPVAQQLVNFDSQLAESESAERWMRRLLAGQCGSLIPSTRADSLMLALDRNLNQEPITVLPAGPTAAEMMLAVRAELAGEQLSKSERVSQAASLVNFATGFVAGLEDRLPHAKTTEKEAEEVAA